MNLHSYNMQLGFLIGIYILASWIVVLTMAYFYRAKPDNKDLKNEFEPVAEPKEIKEKSQSELSKNQPSNQPETVDMVAESLTGVDDLPEPSAVVHVLPEQIEIKEESDTNKFEILKKVTSEKTESPAKPGTEPINSPLHSSTRITVTNAPKAQVESVAVTDSNQEKSDLELIKSVNAKEELETGPVPSPLSSWEENEGSANNDNDDLSKMTSSTDDFSSIFTEDTEENEAGRLAKELKDIDTGNLLQTSQDFISQLKKKR